MTKNQALIKLQKAKLDALMRIKMARQGGRA